ncbi:hypothetical protein DL95DRAFT_505871 [Leptodontidium sp. 2 PMI_412]|nr:hypothetical protein DL95DRAFT_505871 [Leptodontidium sp. 2 PMI_412]
MAKPRRPFFYNFYNTIADPFDTASAQALATALQNRYASLSSVAVIAATTALPNACQCVQVVAADETLGAFDCTNLDDETKYDEARPAPIPAPTGPALTPDTPAPVGCNFEQPDPATEGKVRPVNQKFNFGSTFNCVDAQKASPKFCKEVPYTTKDLLKNCVSQQSYVVVGGVVNNGGSDRVIGTPERIFLSMRWDLGVCPNDVWWARNTAEGDGFETSEAAKYLKSDGAYEDCVQGFTTALSECEGKEAKTHGSKIQYKYMEFLMFENSDVKFQFPCNNDVW